MSWVIKCPSEKDYKRVRKELDCQDIPYKQKEPNRSIKIKESDVSFDDTIYLSLEGISATFALYLRQKDYTTKICYQNKGDKEVTFDNKIFPTKKKDAKEFPKKDISLGQSVFNVKERNNYEESSFDDYGL